MNIPMMKILMKYSSTYHYNILIVDTNHRRF